MILLWRKFFIFVDEKCDTAINKVHIMIIKRDRYLKQVIID